MNQHKWMTEILEDISAYCSLNGFSDLEKAIDHAKTVLKSELKEKENDKYFEHIMAANSSRRRSCEIFYLSSDSDKRIIG